MAPVDGLETRFKELFKDYRARRDEFIANLEAEKENNLRTKLAIIEELKELVSSDEETLSTIPLPGSATCRPAGRDRHRTRRPMSRICGRPTTSMSRISTVSSKINKELRP